jgi:anti-sigma regulatory factor (Ser/Thr protein kinase)
VNEQPGDGAQWVLLADAHHYLAYRLEYPAPACPVVWITTHRVESLLRLAIAHGVHRILPKHAPISFALWQHTLKAVTQRRLPVQALQGVGFRQSSWVLQKSDDLIDGFHHLKAFFGQDDAKHIEDLATVYLEAATNSLYHTVKTPEGHDYYKKGSHIDGLPPEAWVQVSIWQDAEKAGLQVLDKGGSVDTQAALYWLDRHVRGAGLMDVHGRGFYLMRQLTDGMALSVKPGEYTEVLAWQHHYATPYDNKPLLFF